MIRTYYQLTKPGIVKGNLITALAGFIFASKADIDLGLLAALAIGISLVIASACVFNNYLDREIDAKMERTKKRALASGEISAPKAMIFGGALGLLGFVFIIVFINLTTVVLGLIAYVNYIIFYGLAKRRSIHGTLVGTISGALPLAAGYTAATGQIDKIAVTLFFIMVFWQMPHFYAIAIYRLKDYKSAGIPVLPAVKGLLQTKMSMLVYALLFAGSVIYLYFAAQMSYSYLVVMAAAAIFWLAYTLKGFKTVKSKVWAGKMFGLSLRVLVIFSLLISLDSFLP